MAHGDTNKEYKYNNKFHTNQLFMQILLPLLLTKDKKKQQMS